MKKGMVGTCGQPDKPRNIANIPRTKQSAFFLLDSIETHLRNSGLPHHQQFDMPQETLAMVSKLTKKVSQLWVRKRKTSTKDLQQFHRTRKRVRRVMYKQNVQVFAKATVPVLRTSVPKLYGQGFLRKPIAVHPYRPMDTFLGHHRVNVYKNGPRFDVIDALCNIPILAGLSKQGLKKVVAW